MALFKLPHLTYVSMKTCNFRPIFEAPCHECKSTASSLNPSKLTSIIFHHTISKPHGVNPLGNNLKL